MRRILLAAVIALVPLTCAAGGSVEFAQVDRLLKQTPQVRSALLDALVFPDSGEAEVRLGSHFKHLGAARLGPYTFEARVKGGGGRGGAVLVTVCTRYRFLDRAGKVLPEGSDREFEATQVRERVTGVLLGEPGGEGAGCP
jgi:hypothetical protein